MGVLTSNSCDVLLSDTFSELVEVEPNLGSIVFNELCHHLKIRVVDLDFMYFEQNLKAFERHESKVFWFDDLFAESFNYKEFFRPNMVLRYFLMLEYLNLGTKKSHIGISRYRGKSIFICRNRDVLIDKSQEVPGEIQYYSKVAIQRELEILLTLLNDSLKTKLVLALTKYQNLTGEEINKQNLVEKLITEGRSLEMMQKYK